MSEAPLTPPDCDVRDFPKMMVDINRLMGSQFNVDASAVPLAWMVGHKLWYRAFYQLPAGSLPTPAAALCHLAELGADLRAFRKVRPLALRGWRECSDGRLYHPFVAETVLDAWIDKLLQRLKSGAGNVGKHSAKGYSFDPGPTLIALEVAGFHMAQLNPRSRALDKITRRRASDTAPKSKRTESDRTPSDLPHGAHSDSEPPPARVPREGKGREYSSFQSEERLGTGAREPIDQARRAQIASLQVALLEAGGDALADIAVAPALANLSPVLNLLEPGQGPACDLERDVLPVIRQRCARARSRSVKSWNFFIAAICDARDARLAGAPAQSETPHEHRDSRPACPPADPDSRRANTVARRDAWDQAIEERRGPPSAGSPDAGPADRGAPDGPGHLRLAYAGQP